MNLDIGWLGVQAWSLVEIFVLVGLTVYIIFAIVVVRQVNHMTNTLEVGFETPVRLAAWMHLFFAIGTFAVSLFIL